MMNLTSKIKVEILPWTCTRCSFLVTQHYDYCTLCDTRSSIIHIVNKGIPYKKLDKNKRVEKTFGQKTNIILPVLDYDNEVDFKNNITKLYPYFQQKKIHGIWILSSSSSIETIQNIFKWSKKNYPDFWIGINLVGENIFENIHFLIDYNPDGIWVDQSYITDNEIQNIPNILIDQFTRLNWNGLYFGGILFKYQPQIGNSEKICKNALPYMDVLCTSGDATGVPIKLEKLNMIERLANKKIKIAVASGITAENVKNIKNKTDIFILKTSIVDINNNNNINLNKLDLFINSLNKQ